MSTLLVQSCSASKNEVSQPTPALDVYSGYFYRIIKKAMREGAFRKDVDLVILSAKHGLLAPDDPIEFYDQRMDSDRAEALRDDVVAELCERVEREGYSRVVLNMGAEYRQAIEGLDDAVDVAVTAIQGDGIGTKGSVLKQFVRDEKPPLEGTPSVV